MDILFVVFAAIAGAALGFILMFIVAKIRSNSVDSDIKMQKQNAEKDALQIVEKAKSQAESYMREAEIEAKDKAFQYKQQVDLENKERLHEVRSAESRLAQREDSLDKRAESLDSREIQISEAQKDIDIRIQNLENAQAEVVSKLQEVAGMSPTEAKEELLETIHDEVVQESAAIIRDCEEKTKAEADKRARMILSLAIQRVAADHSSENTVSSIHIPNDDIKGRIIGREGRNIRSFEQITGTNLIIDDTPECVTISCFDPVRREIGRVTMENLLADGRIHPARIEEMYDKAVRLVDERVRKAGEEAAFEAGIHDLHPEIIHTLGRLLYRTSYGQNVLNHSLEVAYLSGVIASELGLDPLFAKRAGLLHDLGKAIDHEVDGSHAVIGADLAKRFGESQEIVHAIEAHHEDVEPNSVLDMIVQAADAISAARPGARKETLDNYIKRLEKMEEIANSHDGVERTYAIQAGREVRVMVKPEVVDDAESVVLARDIAKQIENEMQYPGQVKVVVVRESRAVDYAK